MSDLEQRELKRLNNKRYHLKLKLDCFMAYGGPHCCEEGCDVTDLELLELHHPDGGGNKDRAERMGEGLRSPGGWKFYLKLKQAGYPGDYRVICTAHHDRKHGRTPKEPRKHGPPAMDPGRDDFARL